MHPRCLVVILYRTKDVNKFEYLFWKLKAALWYHLQINISATNVSGTEVKNALDWKDILMAQCKTDVYPLLTLWSYHSIVLSHWNDQSGKNCKWNLILTVQTLSFKSPIMHWAWGMAWNVINSLGPSDAIWWQRSGSTLVQVMACCLTAPSHYLNQCWLIISKVEWHSSKGNFIRDTSATIH